MPLPPLRAYFGHHKCATTWIISMAHHVCHRLGLKLVTAGSAEVFKHQLPQFVAANKIDFLCYSNATIEHVNTLDNFRGFHVVRDPRDIIVSAYFSHLHSHPTDEWPALLAHREQLKSVSRDEGLFVEMAFSRQELEDL
jgi:hypothetical protein